MSRRGSGTSSWLPSCAAVALAIPLASTRAALRPRARHGRRRQLGACGKVGGHVWGALKKARPVAETVAVGFDAVVGVLSSP
ncbi:hypothetical protein [Myxococcus sp. Y35]|uniref:hypothetical protein n=1 Tax=Pseudomyxococcus flavus TaxID=3115648 RepID=UPI003CEA38F8